MLDMLVIWHRHPFYDCVGHRLYCPNLAPKCHARRAHARRTGWLRAAIYIAEATCSLFNSDRCASTLYLKQLQECLSTELWFLLVRWCMLRSQRLHSHGSLVMLVR